jgi:hypothetical protein
MKQFLKHFFAYFFLLCISAFVFCYFAFGKHVIETDGMIDGTMLNTFGDFTLYCLTMFLLPFILGAAICATLTKSRTKLNILLIALVYVPIWLLAVTRVAEGCAVNWGNTWSTTEVFFSFVVQEYVIAAPLLLIGLVSNLWMQKVKI